MTVTQEVVRCDLDGLYVTLTRHVGRTVSLNWSGYAYTGPLHAVALYSLTPDEHHHHILLSLTTGRWSVYKAEAVWFTISTPGTPTVMYLLDDAKPNDTLLPDAHWDALLQAVDE